MGNLVSCICPTYARPPNYQFLLEEAIYSFLLQDYADAELIVLNDAPLQALTMEEADVWFWHQGYPIQAQRSETGVKIYNCPIRFPSLGDKYNFAIGLAGGELIMPWEDDDISLPRRISQGVAGMEPFPPTRSGWPTTTPPPPVFYWNPQHTWYLPQDGLHHDHAHGVCHNASVFSKAAWGLAKGYPSISGAQDAEMDGRLKGLSGAMRAPLGDDPSEWQYIYRFGVSPVHLSGRFPHDDFYREVGEAPVQEGRFELKPHWERDYRELIQIAIEKSRALR